MTIHVEEVDITEGGSVVVRGQVSASNISVDIVARNYFQAPLDGIWEFDLLETQPAAPGLMVMTPFAVKVGFPSYSTARGVRIHIPRVDGTNATLTQLKRSAT